MLFFFENVSDAAGSQKNVDIIKRLPTDALIQYKPYVFDTDIITFLQQTNTSLLYMEEKLMSWKKISVKQN